VGTPPSPFPYPLIQTKNKINCIHVFFRGEKHTNKVKDLYHSSNFFSFFLNAIYTYKKSTTIVKQLTQKYHRSGITFIFSKWVALQIQESILLGDYTSVISEVVNFAVFLFFPTFGFVITKKEKYCVKYNTKNINDTSCTGK